MRCWYKFSNTFDRSFKKFSNISLKKSFAQFENKCTYRALQRDFSRITYVYAQYLFMYAFHIIYVWTIFRAKRVQAWFREIRYTLYVIRYVHLHAHFAQHSCFNVNFRAIPTACMRDMPIMFIREFRAMRVCAWYAHSPFDYRSFHCCFTNRVRFFNAYDWFLPLPTFYQIRIFMFLAENVSKFE